MSVARIIGTEVMTVAMPTLLKISCASDCIISTVSYSISIKEILMLSPYKDKKTEMERDKEVN